METKPSPASERQETTVKPMNSQQARIEKLRSQMADLESQLAGSKGLRNRLLQAEESLIESGLRYRELAELIGDVFFSLDEHLRCTYWNSTVETLTGISEHEALGCTVTEILLPLERQVLHELCHKVLKTRQPQNVEFDWRIDGLSRILEMRVTLLQRGIGILGRDVTEQRRLTRDLAEAQQKLEITIQSIPNLMFEVDREGCIYEYIAPARELLYLPPEMFLGKTVREVLPENAAGVIMQSIALAEQKGWYRGGAYSLDMPTGKKWYELSIAVKADPGGKCRYVAMIHNITERKEAEEDNEKLICELRHALAEVKTLRGLLPICASCKKIRNAQGSWNQIEVYVSDHSYAEFSHGLCPACLSKYFGDLDSTDPPPHS